MTEATVQAEFYYQARLLNLTCIMECTTPVGRLDILCLNRSGCAVAIVECKRSGRQIGRGQYNSYKCLGLPIFLLNEFDAAKPLAEKINNMAGVAAGKPLEDIKACPRRRSEFRGKRWKKRPFSSLDLCEEVNYRE